MNDREELVRKRAHQIWEDAGRPHGEDEAHWHQAQDEIDSLAAEGDEDREGDHRHSDAEPDEPALPTTREAAAFALANSKPSKAN